MSVRANCERCVISNRSGLYSEILLPSIRHQFAINNRFPGVFECVGGARLGNYTFLTLCVEIKKANLYRGFHDSILGRFSNAAVDGEVDLSVEWSLPGNKR